jgi:hypothetical protein
MGKGKRNRTAGHNFERLITTELKIFFPGAVTARSESKNLDDLGVDVANTPGFQFQCKNTVLTPNYHELITTMPQDATVKNVVIHRKTKKASSKFVTQGDYVIMRKHDFYDLLENYNP